MLAVWAYNAEFNTTRREMKNGMVSPMAVHSSAYHSAEHQSRIVSRSFKGRPWRHVALLLTVQAHTHFSHASFTCMIQFVCMLSCIVPHTIAQCANFWRAQHSHLLDVP
eukprot:6465535-Amphidinium_carterae.1